MSHLNSKESLIKDIQQLLNTYDEGSVTQINPTLLKYMDEEELKTIIDDLLRQKEHFVENHIDWLNSFKKKNDEAE